MGSVLVKGMDKPDGCIRCRLSYVDNFGERQCGVPDVFLDGGYECLSPDFCPSIQIPTPHGRLIDADKLKEEFENRAITLHEMGLCLIGIEQVIDEAPTIIEEEE